MQYNEITSCVFSEMRYTNIVIRKNRKMLAAPSEDGLKEADFMTKKNYIRTLGMIAESMFMQNPGYSWRGSTACRDFSKTRK